MAPLHNDDVYVMDLDDEDLTYPSSTEFKTSSNLAPPLHEIVEANTSNTVLIKRNVSFVPTLTTHVVMNRDEYTPEEMQMSWFGRNELRQMKEAAKSEAKLVQSGILIESDDVSVRGLENKTADGARRRRQNRLHAYAAVFFEMENQHDMGYVDEDAIADVYCNYSEHCYASAQMIAMRDAEDAKLSLQSMKLTESFGATLLLDLSTSESGQMISSAA